MNEPSPFQGGEPTPPPSAMPKPAPPQALENGHLPRTTISAMPIAVPSSGGKATSTSAVPAPNSAAEITPVAAPTQAPSTPTAERPAEPAPPQSPPPAAALPPEPAPPIDRTPPQSAPPAAVLPPEPAPPVERTPPPPAHIPTAASAPPPADPFAASAQSPTAPATLPGSNLIAAPSPVHYKPIASSPPPITPSPAPQPLQDSNLIAAPTSAPTSPAPAQTLDAQFATSPPPPDDAPLMAAPVVAPIDDAPVIRPARKEASFSKVEEEALQKAPFSWEFRTALIAMSFCTPVFLMVLFAGNFNFFGFSLSIMLIGLLCGLAFRFFSHPWTFPVTSLFTALFTMGLAEALLTLQIGAKAAGLGLFPYFIAVLTINPLDIIMDAMTHLMGSVRGLLVGVIAAFWLACND